MPTETHSPNTVILRLDDDTRQLVSVTDSSGGDGLDPSGQILLSWPDGALLLRSEGEPRGGVTQLDLVGRSSNPFGIYVRRVKPVVEPVIAALVLLLCSPILLVVALAIRVRLGAGVIYRQSRMGRGGRPFTIYKFRTMEPDRRVASRPWNGTDLRECHKREDDPRHTGLGRWLRKTGLDELPQLANVVLGHMSLVGPRPELVEVVNNYEAYQHARHLVKPGITGLWQVTERHAGLITNVLPDLQYVATASLVTDLRILARTVPTLVRRTGV